MATRYMGVSLTGRSVTGATRHAVELCEGHGFCNSQHSCRTGNRRHSEFKRWYYYAATIMDENRWRVRGIHMPDSLESRNRPTIYCIAIITSNSTMRQQRFSKWASLVISGDSNGCLVFTCRCKNSKVVMYCHCSTEFLSVLQGFKRMPIKN